MGSFESRYTDGRYLADTADWHEADAAWKAGHIRRMITLAGAAPASIGDLGCGAGGILHHLKQLMPATAMTGYDISPQAIDIASRRARPGLDYRVAGLEGLTGVRHDLMLMIDVFEHVPDYLGFLGRARPLADAFVFHVPLDLWAAGLIDERLIMSRRRGVGHLHYFTKTTALATLEDCGYRPRHCFFTDSGFFPPDRSWKARLRDAPHRLLHRLAPDLAVRLLGRHSLMVWAET